MPDSVASSPSRCAFAGFYGLLLISLLLLASCSSPRWEAEPDEHFDGLRFHNPEPFPHQFRDLLRFLFSTEREPWRVDPEPPAGSTPPQSVGRGELRATFVNHATVLVQADGINLLTDPIWSDVAGPFRWAGARRYRDPGIAFEQLPPIHVVVISHNHYDHFDVPTLRQLQEAHDPLFVVPAGDGVILSRHGIERYVELDWWQSLELGNGCKLYATPVQHWSGRLGPLDRNLSLWAGYAMETAGGPVYFAGDAGFSEAYRETRQRLGAVRLALLPIGAYLPRDFLKYQHMNPADAVQAHLDLEAGFSMGIHWGTFRLSAEGRDQPPVDLASALRDRQVDGRHFVAPDFGEAFRVPARRETQRCQPTLAGAGR